MTERDYRSAVGPSRFYDQVASMTFNLLTRVGLRENHRLLDIGCGSLRNGRLLIPYLNPGNYSGIEPQEWLLKEGIEHEVGEDLVRIKKVQLIVSNTIDHLAGAPRFDYVLAHSIFSHCGRDLILYWLGAVASCIRPSGIFLATYFQGKEDSDAEGWTGVANVKHRRSSLEGLASCVGLHSTHLSVPHPSHQSWVAFTGPQFNLRCLETLR